MQIYWNNDIGCFLVVKKINLHRSMSFLVSIPGSENVRVIMLLTGIKYQINLLEFTKNMKLFLLPHFIITTPLPGLKALHLYFFHAFGLKLFFVFYIFYNKERIW